MESRFFETNGVRLHARVAGSGPLVLMVHGFPGSSFSWRHQLPALARAGYTALAIDTRGYGASDRPAEGYTAEQVCADLVEVLNQQGTHFEAIAIASDVLLQENDQDAIHVVAEHKVGAALAIVQPYVMPAEPGGEWTFQDPAAEAAEAVWANAR